MMEFIKVKDIQVDDIILVGSDVGPAIQYGTIAALTPVRVDDVWTFDHYGMEQTFLFRFRVKPITSKEFEDKMSFKTVTLHKESYVVLVPPSAVPSGD